MGPLLFTCFYFLMASAKGYHGGPAIDRTSDAYENANESSKIYSPRTGYYQIAKIPLKLYGEGDNAYSNTYLRNPVPLEQEMSFEKLMAAIKDKKLSTVESVIAELPSHMTDLNYVVMYRSRSLQGATPELPRIITYTPTASFMLTFNGNASQAGGQTLEMIQYRRDERRYEFRELVFNGKDVPTVSAANPKKCLECHQSPSRQDVDPRPNWDPYFIWVGAIGSNNGSPSQSIRSRLEYSNIEILPQDNDAFDEQESESEIMNTFVETIAPTHPRYKYLGRLNLKAGADLTNHLGNSNSQRVARLMRAETSIYNTYKEFLYAQLKCLRSFDDIVKGSEGLQWHDQFSFPQYYVYGDKRKRTHSILFGSVGSLMTGIFEPLGVDTSDWSMDFGNGGRMGSTDRFTMPSVAMTVMRVNWLDTEIEDSYLNSIPCDDLYKKGIEKIDNAYATGFQQKMRAERFVPPPQGRDILQRCIGCHVNPIDGFTPEIPFDRPSEITKLLNKPFSRRGTLLDEIIYRTSDMATHREQMPRGRRLSPLERSALLDYLNLQ